MPPPINRSVRYVGDTIDVDLAGDGRATARRVRLTGFNAMELTTYSHTASKRRGDCHGVEAADRLEQLLRRGRRRVRLAAQDPRSRSGGRTAVATARRRP